MRLIYKCGLCGLQQARHNDFGGTKEYALDLAYGPYDTQVDAGILRHRPHYCEEGVLGVASLVGVMGDGS